MLALEIVLAVGALIALSVVIFSCVCGCKNNQQKSELIGTAGVVKLRIDEETASPASTTPASVKRASAQNSQRSLPEIPQPVGRHDSADTASDLIYATVNIDGGTKTELIPSTSGEHGYDYAYAQVQNENHIHVEVPPEQGVLAAVDVAVVEPDAPAQADLEGVVISASVAISGQLPSSQELPYMTPPSPQLPRPQHFSGDSTDSTKGYTSISVREPLSNIRAILTNKTQQHYATVSDDSDEMYAAIDDPNGSAGGSETYAQIAPPPLVPAPTAERRSQEREVERERDRSVLLPSDARRSAPPDVTAVVANHSRQASSSSCSNSVGALGSPKPEKRQANSPLPPPPDTKVAPRRHESPLSHADVRQHRISSTGDLHQDRNRRSLNEKHQRNNSCVSSSDFYGCNYPVEKHRFSSGDLVRPLVARELNFDIDKPVYNSVEGPSGEYPSTEANNSLPDRITESPSRNVEEMYAKVMKKSKKLHLSEDKRNFDSDGSNRINEDPGYETIDRKRSVNHGYETITDKKKSNDPGYETVKEIDKGDANFSNNNLKFNLDSGPNSILSSDPGYEHIAKNCSDSDPNYEVLRDEPPTPPYATIAPNYDMPTYSVINKSRSNNNGEAESNYESMPHDAIYGGSDTDPNYESVRPKDYETLARDPNYESLRLKKDPNYESVRSKSRHPYETLSNDPNYETVQRKDPNYESVKYLELNKEPPYASVAGENELHRSDSEAGYERIRPVTSINGDGAAVVDDYFHV